MMTHAALVSQETLPELSLKTMKRPPSVGTASIVLDVHPWHDPHRSLSQTRQSTRPSSRVSPLRTRSSRSQKSIVHSPSTGLSDVMTGFPTLSASQLEFPSSESVKSTSPTRPVSSGRALVVRSDSMTPPDFPAGLGHEIAVDACASSQETFRKQFLLPLLPSPRSSGRQRKQKAGKSKVPAPSLL